MLKTGNLSEGLVLSTTEILHNASNKSRVPYQVDDTVIIYDTILIIHFFYDITMINLESYMVQSTVSLDLKPLWSCLAEIESLSPTRVAVKTFQILRTASFIGSMQNQQKSHVRHIVSTIITMQVSTP